MTPTIPCIIYFNFEQVLATLVNFEDFLKLVRNGLHWGQIIWRIIQLLGLYKLFKKKLKIEKIFKLFFVLFFLKHEKVQKCFSKGRIFIKLNGLAIT